MFSEIDINAWPRKSTYLFFKDFQDPFFNLTANIDVTNLVEFCKLQSLSFSIAILYCALRAANEIREFRIRSYGDGLVEYQRIHATQTILNEDETFSFCYFEMIDDIFEFSVAAERSIVKYKGLKTFDVETERLDLVYCSAIPWVSFSAFKHASRLDRSQTVPRIVFGRFFDEGGRVKMPLSVEVNHAVADGVHVGKFYTGIQEIVDSYR